MASSDDDGGRRRFSRYVAIGDSITEGLMDGSDETGFRGWADRLAEHLAAVNPGLTYANLAVRGKRTAQIAAEQLGPAIELRPDLVSVCAGMNDVIHTGYDADRTTAEIEAMIAALTASDIHVLVVLLPDLSLVVPLARVLKERLLDFDRRITEVAGRYGATVVAMQDSPLLADQRFWSPDRLHASSLGHERIAAAAAEALGVDPGMNWRTPLPAEPRPTRTDRAKYEASWVVGIFGPWVVSRLRGVTSATGRSAKRPDLETFEPTELH